MTDNFGSLNLVYCVDVGLKSNKKAVLSLCDIKRENKWTAESLYDMGHDKQLVVPLFIKVFISSKMKRVEKYIFGED